MKKKIVLIVVPITLIVIIAVIISILYFTTDTFKSTEELFWKYIAQNSNILDLVRNDKFIAQTDFKNANSYTSNGEINVTVQEGENSSKELNAVTTARHDINSGRTYADATIKNGDIDLFQVSYINSGDIYAIKCDDVLANYVGIQNANLKDLASKYGAMNIDNIPDTFNINEYTSVLQNTDEQNNHIVQTYLPIIQNNVPETQYAKTNQNIQIDGVTYEANVYAVRLTGQNIKQILISALNTLQNDTETLVLLSNKFATLNMGIDYTDITNLALKINELARNIEGIEIEDNIDIYIYEQNEATIRTQIVMGDKFNITYDQIGTKQALTLNCDIPTNTVSNNETLNNTNSNEIIDLETSAVDNTSQNAQKCQIVLTKNTAQNSTENVVAITPDTTKPEENITLTLNMSSIQNNSINNMYSLVYNYIEDNNSKSVIMDYNVNTTKVEQVEVIMELTSSNTAIANNYDANQFSTFINEWIRLFNAKFNEKLALIGFDTNSANTESNE